MDKLKKENQDWEFQSKQVYKEVKQNQILMEKEQYKLMSKLN